jgi:hypothetical protein
LHFKASEIFTLQTEAEFKAKDEKSVEIAKNGIAKGYDNSIIADLTNLSFDQIDKLRAGFEK